MKNKLCFILLSQNLVGEPKKLLKNCKIISVSSLLNFQKNKKLKIININIFILE
jgi:hypothetical protein